MTLTMPSGKVEAFETREELMDFIAVNARLMASIARAYFKEQDAN